MNILAITTAVGKVLVEAGPRTSEDTTLLEAEVEIGGKPNTVYSGPALASRDLAGLQKAVSHWTATCGHVAKRAWVGMATFRLLKAECERLEMRKPPPPVLYDPETGLPPERAANVGEPGSISIEQHNAIVRQKDELIASLHKSLDGRDADVKGLSDKVRLLMYLPSKRPPKELPPAVSDEDLLCEDA